MGQILTACFGEFLGMFILVFFGTSAAAAAVIFSAHSGLGQTALVRAWEWRWPFTPLAICPAPISIRRSRLAWCWREG
jgi:glycerol uptake facilitator-like aquaporin